MKKIAIVTVVAAAITGGVLLYLSVTNSRDLIPLITRKLQQLVKEGSNGLYRLQLDSMGIDPVSSYIVLHGIQLQPDTARLQQLQQQAPGEVYRLSLRRLVINGLSPADLANQKNIRLQTLHFERPVLEIFHRKKTVTPAPDSLTLYQRLSKQIASLQIEQLLFHQASFIYHDLDHAKNTRELKELSCHFSAIRIDASTQYDTTRFLFAKTATLLLKHYVHLTQDGLYRLTIDSLAVLATAKTLSVSGLSLQPAGKKEHFSQKLTYRQDRYDLFAAHLLVTNIDWWNLFLNQRVLADSVQIRGGNIEIYTDRRLPDRKKANNSPYPHQAILGMQTPISLKNIRIGHTNICYIEFNPKSGKTGMVTFNQIEGNLSNITNLPQQIRRNPYMELTATAAFMNAGKMRTVIRFNLAQAKEGQFTLDAQLGAMDGTRLNKATQGLALIAIKEGRVSSFRLHLEANHFRARAQTRLAYQNLKVAVLKKDKDHPGKMTSQGFMSFLTNQLILSGSTPGNGQLPVKQAVSFQRPPAMGFWGFIWKTILKALKPSIQGDGK